MPSESRWGTRRSVDSEQGLPEVVTIQDYVRAVDGEPWVAHAKLFKMGNYETRRSDDNEQGLQEVSRFRIYDCNRALDLAAVFIETK